MTDMPSSKNAKGDRQASPPEARGSPEAAEPDAEPVAEDRPARASTTDRDGSATPAGDRGASGTTSVTGDFHPPPTSTAPPAPALGRDGEPRAPTLKGKAPVDVRSVNAAIVNAGPSVSLKGLTAREAERMRRRGG